MNKILHEGFSEKGYLREKETRKEIEWNCIKQERFVFI